MKNQFEIWRYNWPERGEHPAVIISHPDFCARSVVNVLYCTSQRQNRPPKPFEIMLNGADGCDWESFCDCSIMWSVPGAALFGKRGRVTLERRKAIRALLRDMFLIQATD